MFNDLLLVPYVPFTVALGLLAALLLLEIVTLLLGGSLLASGDADVSIDTAPTTFDLDPGVEPDIPALIAASDAAGTDVIEIPDGGADGIAGVLGLGQSPFLVWLAALLAGFGLVGFGVQWLAQGLGAGPLPALVAAVPAAVLGLGFARRFARGFARALPQVETSATSAQFMGGLRGTVTQGTARAGIPAEVRLRDRHGNLHYLRCEPYRASDIIGEGAEVLTIRERLPGDRWGLRILPTA